MKRENFKQMHHSKKVLIRVLTIFLTCTLASACAKVNEQEKAFEINIICESKDIYQIFYSCYIDDVYCGMGGMADYDHNALTPETELKLTFSESYFEGNNNISAFSIDFSPYGKDDTNEKGTTNRVYIKAEYGKSYTVIFSDDGDMNYTAELKSN